MYKVTMYMVCNSVCNYYHHHYVVVVCAGVHDPHVVVVCAGVLQADPGVIRDNHQLFRLFCHEAQRVFHDRLINNEDKMFFHEIMSEMAHKHFGEVCFLCFFRFYGYLGQGS